MCVPTVKLHKFTPHGYCRFLFLFFAKLFIFSGFLTEDSSDFANSWAVKGADQSCRRVSKLDLSCNSTKDTSVVRRQFTHLCMCLDIMHASTFKKQLRNCANTSCRYIETLFSRNNDSHKTRLHRI